MTGLLRRYRALSRWARISFAIPALFVPLFATVSCQPDQCRSYTYNTNVISNPVNVGVAHVSATLYICWRGSDGAVTTFEPRGLFVQNYGAFGGLYQVQWAGPYRTASNAVLWTMHTRQCYAIKGIGACSIGTNFWIGGHFDPPWKVGFHGLGGYRVGGTEERLSN